MLDTKHPCARLQAMGFEKGGMQELIGQVTNPFNSRFKTSINHKTNETHGAMYV